MSYRRFLIAPLVRSGDEPGLTSLLHRLRSSPRSTTSRSSNWSSKYARAIDTCSNNGYDYADLFAADGYFAPEVNGKVGNKMQGRERLAEASGGGSRGCKNVGWIRQGVKHLYVNHIITPTAEGATGTVDMLMIGLGGDPNRIRHEGYYEDTYVKTAQGWRFKSRIHHVPRRWHHRAGAERTRAGSGTAPDAVPAAPAPER